MHRDVARRNGEGQVCLVTVLDDLAHLPETKWPRDAVPDATIGFRSSSPDVQVHATLACAGMAALARDRADGEAGLVRLYPRQT
jgi:hypothetical protein